MAGFLSTTKTFTCKDKYSSYWQQASVKVTINSAGKISWTVTMNNDREGSKGRGVYLHIKINGQTVKSKGYTVYDDPSSSKWLTYPTGNGSTDSGTLTMQNTSGEYVTVYIYTLATACPSATSWRSSRMVWYLVTTLIAWAIKNCRPSSSPETI